MTEEEEDWYLFFSSSSSAPWAVRAEQAGAHAQLCASGANVSVSSKDNHMRR